MTTMIRIPATVLASCVVGCVDMAVARLTGGDTDPRLQERAHKLALSWRNPDVLRDQIGHLISQGNVGRYLKPDAKAALEVHDSHAIGFCAYIDPGQARATRLDLCEQWVRAANRLAKAEGSEKISPRFQADWDLRSVSTAALVAIGAEMVAT